MVKIVGETINKARQNANTSHVFMQQAETVTLFQNFPAPLRVTDLRPNHVVLGWEGHDARHVGVPIQGGIEER